MKLLGSTTTFTLSRDDRWLMQRALVHANEVGALESDQKSTADALYRHISKSENATKLTLDCGRTLVLRYAVRAAIESEALRAWKYTLGRLDRRLEHAAYRILR